ncbi:MAG: hypothetical protein DRJ09_01795 [Bacteroidetes bacterium]|nr:MAG: hypothetical protein DRJ09_01795 [Bacteroidota bacterium]
MLEKTNLLLLLNDYSIKNIVMCPRSKEQYEEIRKNKRDLILKAALELFAENGFHNTTINSIAQKTNISSGLLYNYFESKDDLLRKIVSKGITEIITSLGDNKNDILTKDEFVHYIKENFNIIKNNLNFWRLYIAIIIQPSVLKIVKDEILNLYSPLLKKLENYFIAQGVENPVVETKLFSSIMDGVSINYVLDSENFPLKDVINLIILRFCY